MKLMLVALMVALLGVNNVRADEGMWLLGRTDPKAMAVARSLGLQLTDAELYGEDGTSLKDCVVDFGDFCSGVIVSKDGLVFTNHHCGFGAIQKLSTPEDDILGNGFVARTHEEERPAKGLYVKIWQRSEDVTEEVNAELQKIYADETKGHKLGRQREAVLYNQFLGTVLSRIASRAEQQAEKDSLKGIVCEAKPFEGGRVYLLNYYRQYSDIRLVFTVPQSLGKFGGDTDNWMWPRQTADFSVFRIYADKNGEPAEYNENNIPLHPKRWAKVSIDGFDQGSYCMTIGYPGSTSRYLSRCYRHQVCLQVRFLQQLLEEFPGHERGRAASGHHPAEAAARAGTAPMVLRGQGTPRPLLAYVPHSLQGLQGSP